MILRRRTVELLDPEQLPAGIRDEVDRVLVLGGLPCSTIATRTAQPVVMTVGLDRGSALRRLAARLAGRAPDDREGPGNTVSPARVLPD